MTDSYFQSYDLDSVVITKSNKNFQTIVRWVYLNSYLLTGLTHYL